jgi:hypothetical protein
VYAVSQCTTNADAAVDRLRQPNNDENMSDENAQQAVVFFAVAAAKTRTMTPSIGTAAPAPTPTTSLSPRPQHDVLAHLVNPTTQTKFNEQPYPWRNDYRRWRSNTDFPKTMNRKNCAKSASKRNLNLFLFVLI